jgi:hypothetical protein
LTLTDLKFIVAVMLDRYPDLAEKHVGGWLGGKAEFLKA